MLSSGATFLDIGGYSTRPGADDISLEEERSRVIPAIRDVKKAYPDGILSIDTYRSEIARNAVEEGASMINDVTGGQGDPEMFSTVGDLRVPYVLMHMRGDPKSMKSLTNYHNLFKEISVYLNRRIQELQQYGVADIIIDPGFGFAKTIDQNYGLLKNLSYFNMIGLPVLAGLSRKSMIYRTLQISPDAAKNGTVVLNTLALLKKASILRVHDVKETIQIINLLTKGGF